ncbi:MAG: hypothetical protein QF615_08935, partial [Planctomycetota bacterium]|nr:hypothetical protein [Planctomycetota bacterium]
MDFAWLQELFEEHRRDLMMALFALGGTIVRAMGITVQSGQRALRFTGGRGRGQRAPRGPGVLPGVPGAPPPPPPGRPRARPAPRGTPPGGVGVTGG